MTTLTASPLGKISDNITTYQPDLLFPIPRKSKRDEIYVPVVLPFAGNDVWNSFEISWLNQKGKPLVAVGEFIFPCESANIVESKSFKLYLNSFNNTEFASLEVVMATMVRDLSAAVGADVYVKLVPIANFPKQSIETFSGINLDTQDIVCDVYTVTPDYLITEASIIDEVVFSDLLRSNCLVTGQPDWGSVKIHYLGHKINHAGLLKYLVSFRNHIEFHEQCVERIFMDIMTHCQPEKLSVEARYTRRGGLDINPYRSTEKDFRPANVRLCRQ
jgi:7-cyano-7-deazaguanine reductase